MIHAGETTATITVQGEDLGGVVTIEAGIGDARLSMPLRVGGLYLSEVLYDVSGTDDQKEWIELYNASSRELSLAGLKVQSNNGLQGFVDVLTLAGTIAPGACVVVGGPMTGAGAANFTPEGFAFEVVHDFATDLGNAGDADDAPPAPADAIQLTMASGAILDNVIYGRNNSGSMTDEDGGVPGSPDAVDVEPGRSLERTAPGVAGAWRAQSTPNPGNCGAISP